MPEEAIRQLLYISTVHPRSGPIDAASILAVSRRNNSRAQITGLLWFDGKRFLQALEGQAEAVDATVARIRADPRHRAIVILSDRLVEKREFGPWAMASASEGGEAADRVSRLVADVGPDVRASFEGFTHLRRAA